MSRKLGLAVRQPASRVLANEMQLAPQLTSLLRGVMANAGARYIASSRAATAFGSFAMAPNVGL